MLSKCANPDCFTPFLYFRGGKLFRWDPAHDGGSPETNPSVRMLPRKMEYYWLCSDCASKLEVVFRAGAGVTVRPLKRALKTAS